MTITFMESAMMEQIVRSSSSRSAHSIILNQNLYNRTNLKNILDFVNLGRIAIIILKVSANLNILNNNKLGRSHTEKRKVSRNLKTNNHRDLYRINKFQSMIRYVRKSSIIFRIN